jgi:dynactin-5
LKKGFLIFEKKMEQTNVILTYSLEKYIHTSTGNIISRSALICKPQALEVPGGKCVIDEDVEIRADLAAIQLNKYSQIQKGCTLRPCHTLSDIFKFIPMTIGANTLIGENTIVEAAVIGAGCNIGKNCIISERVILKDYVKVLDGTIILPDMVIPPFSIVGERPARILGMQSESMATLASQLALDRYKSINISS